MKFKLTVRPAIHPTFRHGIEDLLKNMGFHVISGGGHTDGSECDISFEKGGKKSNEVTTTINFKPPKPPGGCVLRIP